MRDEGVYSPPDSDALAFAKAQEIARCELCDDSGMRGARVCDHIDRSAIYQRGMQKVREILENKHA